MPAIYREWAMPNSETFSILPIKILVNKYVSKSEISIDPFARNSKLCTHTNDLNPKTDARFHMKAKDFLNYMDGRITADLVLFDPPYSLRQVKECYESVGDDFTQTDSQEAVRWNDEKDLITDIVKIGGYVISFGWNSIGMGRKRGYAIEEMLIVCHGGGHNDTICTVEKKICEQTKLAI